MHARLSVCTGVGEPTRRGGGRSDTPSLSEVEVDAVKVKPIVSVLVNWQERYHVRNTFHQNALLGKRRKRSEEMQTLRAGCSKSELKIFAPPKTTSRRRGTAKI